MNNTKNHIVGKKDGTVTIDVFKTEDNYKFFYIKADNENVLNICDILEKTLKLY